MKYYITFRNAFGKYIYRHSEGRHSFATNLEGASEFQSVELAMAEIDSYNIDNYKYLIVSEEEAMILEIISQ